VQQLVCLNIRAILIFKKSGSARKIGIKALKNRLFKKLEIVFGNRRKVAILRVGVNP